MANREEAPLEQNEKHLDCDGVHYKIVQEEPKPHEINHNPIAESRAAFMRALKRNMGVKLRKKDKGAGCYALKAQTLAAGEEIAAEERHIRKEQADAEFLSRIKTAVHTREELEKVKHTRHMLIQVSESSRYLS